VDVCEKPEPGEKKEKLTSKFFNRKAVTVKLGERGVGNAGASVARAGKDRKS